MREMDDARPEYQLLRLCARSRLEARHAIVARLPSIDWERALSASEYHRLTPVLANHLTAIRETPAEVRAILVERASAVAMRNLELTATLVAIVAALEVRGIEVIPYKGPVLALSAWGSVALRPYVDLDLLVRDSSVDAALRCLSSMGYRNRYRFSAAQAASFTAVDGDYPLEHESTRVLVELHCRVASTRFVTPLRTEDLFSRARDVDVAGRRMRTMSGEDTIVALALHGAKHRWSALGWIADLAEVVRAETIDWELALRIARESNATRAVITALLLANSELGMPLPTIVSQAARADRASMRQARDLAHRLSAAPAQVTLETAKPRSRGTAAMIWFNFRMLESWTARIRFILRWLFTPTPEDYAAVPLPDSLSFLYAVMRPARLGIRYALRGD